MKFDFFGSVRVGILSLTCIALGLSELAVAVDTVSPIVNTTNATGGNPMGAFAYNPNTDTMYITSINANSALRRVTNVGGVQVSTVMSSEAQTTLFHRDGNPQRGSGVLLQLGLIVNPVAVGNRPAYSFAIVSDPVQVTDPNSSTVDPAKSNRFYIYNLQGLPNVTHTPPRTEAPYDDGRDVFTQLVTLKSMRDAIGSTVNTTNTGREPVFSGDGQSFYFTDSSTVYRGLWKTDIATGTTTRLASQDDITVEPAVITAGGIDSIYVRGGGTTGNLGGIDKFTHNLTSGATTNREIVVTSAAMKDFLELPGATVMNTQGISSDVDGNLYIAVAERKGIFKLDPQGRLSKVMSSAERTHSLGIASPNANALRMQPRTITYSGPNGTFNIPQIMYGESSPGNMIAGANVFKAGDFNRDNTLSSLDIDLFKSENVLTTRGVAMTTVSGFTASDYRFDMNGNEVTDWKDVKIMQQFFDFGDGDADLNGIVDFADFQIMQNSFGSSGKTFLQGDFTGDNLVDFADFQVLQNSFNYQSSVLIGAAPAEFNAAEWNSFVANVVPEPSSFALIVVACVSLEILRRRKVKTASFMSKRDANR